LCHSSSACVLSSRQLRSATCCLACMYKHNIVRLR
jgi:hypothetical protein